jgi:hypothetical protein
VFSTHRWSSDRLDEKDVAKEDSDEETINSVYRQPHTANSQDGLSTGQGQGQAAEDDDVLIEDFDD